MKTEKVSGETRPRRVLLLEPEVVREREKSDGGAGYGTTSVDKPDCFTREGADIFRIAFVCAPQQRADCEELIAHARRLAVGPKLDFAIRSTKDDAGDAHCAIVFGGVAVKGARVGFPLVEFAGNLELAVATTYSMARGTRDAFDMDGKGRAR
jgi:hypothetical protein